MKYNLSPRKIPRVQAIFHRISLVSSQYRYSTIPVLSHYFGARLSAQALLTKLMGGMNCLDQDCSYWQRAYFT